uniref:Permease n=1 Tax=Solibacter usitatus (strain Ellin6076) TaxID=234267 RepID=Q01X80_SOLUE
MSRAASGFIIFPTALPEQAAWHDRLHRPVMQTLLQDLRYCLRQLIKSPGFALTAVISLALGIGATSAVFSVIYAALMNPYPYPAADRIVRLTVRTRNGNVQNINLSGPELRQVRQLPAIESMLAMDFHAMTMTGRDLPENVNIIGTISNGFDDLGVPAVLGRGIARSDTIDGQEPQAVAVLSYKFWQQRFFADPRVVGKTLQLDHKLYTIVGVAAPRFTWYSADVWLPLKLDQDPQHRCIIDFRLKPGMTHQAVNSALQPLLDQFAHDLPKRFPERFKVEVEGLNEWVIRSISGTLYLLLGAVALLLAIGCGNVSILLLAQGTARQHEFAVRAAVGAHSRRIMRQLLTESLLLAFFGVTLGVLASYGILAIIKSVLPRFAFAPEVVIVINLPVLVFSGAVAIVTAILFGVWPALQLSRTQVGQVMVSNVRRVAGSVRGRRAHHALIVGQIALTLVLLAGAGSAMQSFLKMIHTPLGYDPHNVMSVGIPVHENFYTTWAARGAYFEQLRAKVAETPGVTMTAISSNATPPRNGSWSRFEILGKPAAEEQSASINLVNPAYFPLLRIPLLEGRIWSETENHNGSHVAVINHSLAQRYFPNGDAIGHSVKLPNFEDRPPVHLTPPNIGESWLPIVGVVADAKNDGLGRPITPAVYVPFTLNLMVDTQILVKSQGPPLALLRAVRAQLSAVNPDQQTYTYVEDLETWISDEPQWQQEHLAAWIFGVFGILALALSAVGLFSVVSYTVAQRTNEFGIRMALGAQPRHVLRIVFQSTLVSVGSGIVAGLALTLALNTILARWATGNSRDPLILVAGALLLAIVASVACAIPAWHASKVDPMTALRCE